MKIKHLLLILLACASNLAYAVNPLDETKICNTEIAYENLIQKQTLQFKQAFTVIQKQCAGYLDDLHEVGFWENDGNVFFLFKVMNGKLDSIKGLDSVLGTMVTMRLNDEKIVLDYRKALRKVIIEAKEIIGFKKEVIRKVQELQKGMDENEVFLMNMWVEESTNEITHIGRLIELGTIKLNGNK